jgi:DNA repair exonuclease SbcCD ATPase subunit
MRKTNLVTLVILTFVSLSLITGCGDGNDRIFEEERAQARQTVESAISEVEAQIEILREESAEASEAAREEIEAQIEALQDRQSDLENLRDDVADATADTWDDVKQRVAELSGDEETDLE